ncbi:DinB family protein [Flagellimonas meridianipacifica]|uniref:DinB family protein n=1 Tax=Flagellimonas meridianipacifica TaxID=1080225 RepID=A0A2T0MGG5_9FLAO|nr:DinB family protein [Allomuricauda pacifica]PRX56671.1 DinB family protein [Allomuricauda pacifica]
MKKIILPVLVLTFFSFSKDTTKLTEAERTMVIELLEETRDHMKSVINGLTEEQLNFKAEESSWSIAECVEHLAISENAFGGFIQKTVASGANPALRDSLKFKDEQLMGIITDRSNRVKTTEAFEPSGKFGSFEETVKAFMEKRKEHIEYVRTTNDDLRNRYNSDLPFGTVDGLQVIIFAAGHTERHVLQMEEVMAHKSFPKGK